MHVLYELRVDKYWCSAIVKASGDPNSPLEQRIYTQAAASRQAMLGQKKGALGSTAAGLPRRAALQKKKSKITRA